MKRVVIAGGGTAGWIAAAALSQQLGDAARHHAGRVRRDRHDRRRRIDRAADACVPQAAAASTSRSSCARRGDLQARHLVRELGSRSAIVTSTPSAATASRPGCASSIISGCAACATASRPSSANTASSGWRRSRAGSPPPAIRHQLRVPHRRRALCEVSAHASPKSRGVKRVEGKIKSVQQNPATGFIESLHAAVGRVVAGRPVHRLHRLPRPADRADLAHRLRGLVALAAVRQRRRRANRSPPARPIRTPAPSRTKPAGAGSIPLQHRVGNGFVYCSRYLSDEDAKQKLLQAVERQCACGRRWHSSSAPGRRRKAWNKNCVALGLASGFVEPLESTSIHMIITGATRLMQLFPFNGMQAGVRGSIQRRSRALEIEKIRDFIVLHYHTTDRDDTPFWRYCRNMEIPDSLARRIELFKEGGHAYQARGRAVPRRLVGAGDARPRRRAQALSPLASRHAGAGARARTARLESERRPDRGTLPRHLDFINSYCRTDA